MTDRPAVEGQLSPSAVRLRHRLIELNIDRSPLRTRASRLLTGAVLAIPVAALLGVAEFIWPILALPLAIHLFLHRRVYAPRAFFVWLAFLGVAVVAVATAGDGYVALATYGAASVVFLLAFNLPEDELPDRVVIRAVAVFWVALAVSGMLGVFTGTTEFLSVGATVAGPAEGSDLSELMEVSFAVPLKEGQPGSSTDLFNHRPSGILPFANHWGSAVVMFLGAAVVLWFELRGTRSGRWLGLLAIATVVPFVLSRNRWAWLTLPVIVVYLIIRYWRPNPMLARTLLTGLVVAGLVVAVTPLSGIVTDRFEDESGHRPDQYELSLELAAESPWLGYGTIQQGETEEGEPRELGADSQLLYSIVAYGYPATVLLTLWFLLMTWASRDIASPITAVTHIALVVLLIQAPFYVFLPHRLILTMLLAGATYRRVYQRTGVRRPVLLLAGGRQ